MKMPKIIDLKNKRFHRLLVVDGPEIRKQFTHWKCKCDCGNFKWIAAAKLKNGHTKSCGCYRKIRFKENLTTHGLRYHPLYNIWNTMKQRCLNENTLSYEYYGGRGIKVCKSWHDDFIQFYKWSISNGYKKELQIDRIDNDGDYKPSNCRFVTSKVNNNNRRSCRLITFNGVTKNTTQWSELTGIGRTIIISRIERGWAVRDALTKPPRKKRKL